MIDLLRLEHVEVAFTAPALSPANVGAPTATTNATAAMSAARRGFMATSLIEICADRKRVP